MNSSKLQIVIARYNEPTIIDGWNWIEFLLDNNFKVFLYNKARSSDPKISDEIKNHKNCVIENLENKGREAGTYLHHIIKNFDRLPEHTLFLQGNPFEHDTDLIESSQIGNEKLKLILEKGPPDTYEKRVRILLENLNHLVLRPGFMPLKYDLHTEPLCGTTPRITSSTTATRNVDRYKNTFKKLFKANYPEILSFTQGAQFIVSKEAICFREKKFYEKAHALVNNSIRPLEAFIYERYWGIIFDGKTRSA